MKSTANKSSLGRGATTLNKKVRIFTLLFIFYCGRISQDNHNVCEGGKL